MWDLGKAWAALSFAFAVLLGGTLSSLSFLIPFAVSGFTVGLGFLFHELSHRYVAGKFKAQARFESFDQMLVLAILMSFAGFVLAAPGAVRIVGRVNKRQNGLISASGIAANLLLAAFFTLLSWNLGSGFFQAVAHYGQVVNSWLALFNLIPVGNFDGGKVLAWDKFFYGIMVLTAVLMVFGF